MMSHRLSLVRVVERQEETIQLSSSLGGIVLQSFSSNFAVTQLLLICGVLGRFTNPHSMASPLTSTGASLVKCLGENPFLLEIVILTKHNLYSTWWAHLLRRICPDGVHFQVVKVSRVSDSNQEICIKCLKSMFIPAHPFHKLTKKKKKPVQMEIS